MDQKAHPKESPARKTAAFLQTSKGLAALGLCVALLLIVVYKTEFIQFSEDLLELAHHSYHGAKWIITHNVN